MRLLSPALIVHVAVATFILLAGNRASAAEGAGFDEEILVVAPTPAGGRGLAADKLPFNVQSADSDALERAQALDLTDFLSTQLGSVNINSAQNNPLQPDVQFRGYAASPLLGLSQGVAVYQNGVRINEPLGDAVNWDLVPESAVHSISLVGGSNPLFGLNALGGALTVEMKNGFNFTGHQAEIAGGAWGRVTTSVESGGNNGTFGYYANVSYFEEDGWRDLSASDALNVYAAASWRGARGHADLGFQFGDTELTGNGAAPAGLLEVDRDAIFTAPDITENEMVMFTFEGGHDFSERLGASLTGFYRDNQTDSFNGDGSELAACRLGGNTFLVEGLEDDDLGELGLDDDDVCDGDAFGVAASPDPIGALEAALNALAGDDEFNLDDIAPDELSGTGVISDAAINNISDRDQQSYGADLQLTLTEKLFGRGNHFVGGFAWFRGEARFDSVTELAAIDPVTRSTAGLGVGTFLDEEATSVSTSTQTLSLYFMDALDVTERFTFTFGARYNNTGVELRDRSGERPELNGDHSFSRFNPTVGGTFDFTDHTNGYASYSESSRAPTPIELACNEGVFRVARAFAVAAGDDPDDIDFECRLPNAFLADPPLDLVVARTVEFGLRGTFLGIRHRLGYFRTENRDDIIFQTTGRGTGLFANVDETRREGFESAFVGAVGALDWSLSYSYVRATFEDDFMVLSPNHPFANDAGEVQVEAGDRIPGIPDHQFKFSGDYALPWDLRVGLEVIYNAGQYLRGDESNQLGEIDGYAVVNLRGSYRIDERFELFARVTNLFDNDYENFGLLGEAPGEILPGLANQSPVFLGAGAPLAGWVGLRVRL
ncbi:MAG: TonB-dependent receptor [Gammaproteobacteria bacterium]